MKYTILVDNRRDIVTQMEVITGEKPRYTRMPRCAFVLRGVVVENNGTVTTEENADMELIDRLIEAGMIESTEATAETEAATEAEEATAEAAQYYLETLSNAAEETDISEDRTREYIDHRISFPLSKYGSSSVNNLVYTIYARGSLISKATKGTFEASKELVEKLQSGLIIKKEDAIAIIRAEDSSALKGISFEDDQVIFDGFPATDDPQEIRAWAALAEAINQACIKQKHIRPKKVDETNERFAFRTWLTRLGMNGSDTKEERSVLYRYLTGHTAFRTEADREKWTQRQNEKRDELRRHKEEARQDTEQGNI